jgi:glycosidase
MLKRYLIKIQLIMKKSVLKCKAAFVIFILVGMLLFGSCNQPAPSGQKASNIEATGVPPWHKNAVIYEVNLRQYTPEGTIKAFVAQLPKLKDLGVDILWFMPVHPIGLEGRKGTLGSYYSVRDYCDINPEFGNLEDFKMMVEEAHRLGLKVIIDWVANHTSRDHKWVTEHPDWYVQDSITHTPVGPYDWTDVAQLNFSSKEMQAAQIEAMKFWVSKMNIDGFRCDVAGLARDYVTEQQAVSFWESAKTALETIKPVFMLAENEDVKALLNKAFNANYAWEFHHLMNAVAQGKDSVPSICKYFEKEITATPHDAYRLTFTSNHDENSWSGTEFARLGTATRTFAVLSYVVPGFPLIYSGQEAGSDRSLSFFEKDLIDWRDANGYFAFYKQLIKLKKDYSPLWNGKYGADIFKIKTNNERNVLAFVREDSTAKVFVIFNLSNAVARNVELQGDAFYGDYTEYFSGMKVKFDRMPSFILNPWDYKVYVMKKK